MPFPFDKDAEKASKKDSKNSEKKAKKKDQDPIKGLKDALKAKEVPAYAQKVAAGMGPLK